MHAAAKTVSRTSRVPSPQTATTGAITLDVAGDLDADVTLGGMLSLTTTGDVAIDATGALSLGPMVVNHGGGGATVDIRGDDHVTLDAEIDLDADVDLTLEAGATHDLTIDNALTAGSVTLTAGNNVIVTSNNPNGSGNQDVTVDGGTLTVNAGQIAYFGEARVNSLVPVPEGPMMTLDCPASTFRVTPFRTCAFP